MTALPKLATGANNTAGLKYLHEVDPPKFARYKAGVRTEWHESEGRVRSGDHALKLVGRPYMVITLDVLTWAELKKLEATYYSGVQQKAITVYAFNKNTQALTYYNGQIEKPIIGQDAEDRPGYVYGTRLYIYDLESFTVP